MMVLHQNTLHNKTCTHINAAYTIIIVVHINLSHFEDASLEN